MSVAINNALNSVTNNSQKRVIKNFLTKELSNYKNKLAYLYKEVNHSKRYDDSIKRKIYLATRSFLSEASILNKRVTDKLLLKNIKRLSRDYLGPFIYKSRLLKHGYIKPAGYPGDHIAIEHIYENKPISKGFGYYLDLFALNDGYPNALRDRKNEMRKKLHDFIQANKYKNLDILNLGAGSCREIREILDALTPTANIRFTLIDQDKNALSYAKSQLGKYSNDKLRFEYIRGNIMSISRDSNKFKKDFGKYDMVYSIGLADYIPAYYMEKIIRFSFKILKEQGAVIIAHKDIVAHSSLMSDWFCDWNFIPRDKNSLLRIFKNSLKREKCGLTYEKVKEGRIVFISITKDEK